MRQDSWKLFKKWIEQNYKEQLEYITTQQDIDAQDSGEKCHLVENVRIHDILLPRGFSFTHLYVQSMPEDGKPFQIDLRGYKKGAQGFWDACNSCVASIKSAVVDNEDACDLCDPPLWCERGGVEPRSTPQTHPMCRPPDQPRIPTPTRPQVGRQPHGVRPPPSLRRSNQLH